MSATASGRSESECGPRRDALSAVVPVTAAYALIFATGAAGNVGTCVVVARNRAMHTATNFYLVSLAVSDLAMLVAGLPLELYTIWRRWPFALGGTVCFLRGLVAETATNATVLTITAFTVERYLAICRPFLAHTMSRPERAARLCICAWIAAFCLAVPQVRTLDVTQHCKICMIADAGDRHFFVLSSVLFFVVPMAIISILYILIGLRLRASANAGSRSRAHGKSSRKVVKMLVAVVVAFFICWAPFHAQRLYSMYATTPVDDKEKGELYLKIYEIVTYVSGAMYYFSATINPILYNIMSVKFREAFKDTFSWCLRRDRKPKRQYSALSRSNPRDQNSTDSGKEDATVTIHTNSTLTPKTSADSFNGQLKRFKPRPPEPPDPPPPPRACAAVLAPPPRLSKLLKLLGCARAEPTSRPLSLSIGVASEAQPIGRRHSGVAMEMVQSAVVPVRAVYKHDVSNSSLKELGNGAIDDELTAYMKELKRREMCG